MPYLLPFCKIQKNMHCHCGTNNRATRRSFTNPCKPEGRPCAREESASMKLIYMNQKYFFLFSSLIEAVKMCGSGVSNSVRPVTGNTHICFGGFFCIRGVSRKICSTNKRNTIKLIKSFNILSLTFLINSMSLVRLKNLWFLCSL